LTGTCKGLKRRENWTDYYKEECYKCREKTEAEAEAAAEAEAEATKMNGKGET
jgi:hypothetical protein